MKTLKSAFLAQGLMRCRTRVWDKAPDSVKKNVIDCFKSTRKMKPYESNWLLFASEIEAFQMGDVARDGENGIILAQLQIGLKCLRCVHIVHRSVRPRRRSR